MQSKRDGSRDDKWHSHGALDRRRHLELRAWPSERAQRDSAEQLALAFYQLPVAPYAPVRRQLLIILHEVNRIRKLARESQLPAEVPPLRRRVVRPFGERQHHAERSGSRATRA